METETIVLLSKREIEKMRRVGRLAAKLLDHLEPLVKAGVTTLELDEEAESWTQAHGARSAPLGYHGFPKSICTSINEVICHGIPNEKQVLKEGDIINIDVTPILDGYHGGKKLRTGMVFTIEPMINEGTWEGVVLDDGWTAITKDGKLSAQFEHTVAVTETGVEILTQYDG